MGFTSEGFKIETVKSCPITRGSQGVMTMTAEHIAMIATAVRDKIEWMVLLHGERSADGYEVTVDRFTVPLQYRSGAEVELADDDFQLPADCVGVMHSHHSMGAFFSGTDTGELNPRFPSSIVVAIANNNLGFKYQAVGKVMLPCGALGSVDFELAVAGNERYNAEPIRTSHNEEAVAAVTTAANKEWAGLAGCSHREYVNHPTDSYLAIEQSACGLTRGDEVERPFVFGTDSENQILAAVQQQTREKQDRRLPAHYGKDAHYASGYWTWEHGRQVFKEYGVPSNGNGNFRHAKLSKKQAKRQAKLSARRNGLVKLDRPGDDFQLPDEQSAGTTGYKLSGRCDDCGLEKPLKRTWNPFISDHEWLCSWCDADLEKRVEREAASGGEQIIVDKIPMADGFGWGV